MRSTNAFIFDLDGTLVDSLRDIGDALNHALARLQQRRASLQEVRRWIGDGLPTLCLRAMPGADQNTLARLIRLTDQHYRAHCTVHTRLYPKVLPMLNLLKNRGAPMAVLSNKPHPSTLRLVARLKLGRFLDEVHGCREEREKKPAPQQALRIARLLDVEPRAVFLVGDSPVDVQTARNAGMIAVAATWGFSSRAELLAAEPDLVVDDPARLPWLSEETPI